jgi:rhodanese-related sulfurtransferase
LFGAGLLELVTMTGKRILFYCAFGERSAMAVQAALRRSGQDDVKRSQSNAGCDCRNVS